MVAACADGPPAPLLPYPNCGAGLGAGLTSAKISTWFPLAASPLTFCPFTLPRTRLSKSVTSAAAIAPSPELAGPAPAPAAREPLAPAPLLSSRRFSSARCFMCSCSTRVPRVLITDMNLANWSKEVGSARVVSERQRQTPSPPDRRSKADRSTSPRAAAG